MLQGIVNRIGEVNVELMKYRFNDFLKSKGTKYHPLIWNLGNGMGGDGKGFFNFRKDENGNAIRDYDTAKRIRRRVTLQQKQFKVEEYGK